MQKDIYSGYVDMLVL